MTEYHWLTVHVLDYLAIEANNEYVQKQREGVWETNLQWSNFRKKIYTLWGWFFFRKIWRRKIMSVIWVFSHQNWFITSSLSQINVSLRLLVTFRNWNSVADIILSMTNMRSLIKLLNQFRTLTLMDFVPEASNTTVLMSFRGLHSSDDVILWGRFGAEFRRETVSNQISRGKACEKPWTC